MSKFVRRNKAAMATTAIVAVALMLATVVSAWQEVRATRAEQRAERERDLATAEKRRADEQAAIAGNNALRADRQTQNARREADKLYETITFLRGIFKQISREQAQTVRSTLDKESEKLDAGVLTDKPEVEIALRKSLKDIYADLDQWTAAERHTRAALELTKRTHGPNHSEVAERLVDLQETLRSQGKLPEAEDALREVLAIRRANFGEDSFELVGPLETLADVLRAQGDTQAAEQASREAEETFRRSLVVERKLNPDSAELAIQIIRLARRVEAKRDLSEAEALFREALAIRRKLFPEDSMPVAESHRDLAVVLSAQGKTTETESLWRERIATLRGSGNHAELATALCDLGLHSEATGKMSDAEQHLRQALAIRRKLFGEDSGEVTWCLERLTEVLRQQGKTNDIQALWRERLAYWQRELEQATTDKRRAEIHLRMFRSYLETGQVEQAKATCRKALELNATNESAVGALNAHAWELATSADLSRRDATLTVQLAERAVELAPNDADIRNTLGIALYRAGDHQRAVKELEKSVQLGDGGHAADYFFLAMAHHQLEEREAAQQWHEKAVKWMDEHASQDEELQRFRAEAEQVLSLTAAVASQMQASIPTSQAHSHE